MKPNIGAIDRFLRLAAGLLLVSFAITGAIGPWGYLGVLPLLSGLFRFCPVYHLLGIHTGASGGHGTHRTHG